MIIGLGYKARSGKDTIADHLCKKFGFHRGAFAGALKDAAREIFGLSWEQLYGSEKEIVDPYWRDTPRKLLQMLGTECLRKGYSDDVWIRALRRHMLLVDEARRWTSHWVITDVRFPNEAAAIKEWGGLLWRVDRPTSGASGGVVAHPSETALDGFAGWDAVIENNSTLEDLYLQVGGLL